MVQHSQHWFHSLGTPPITMQVLMVEFVPHSNWGLFLAVTQTNYHTFAPGHKLVHKLVASKQLTSVVALMHGQPWSTGLISYMVTMVNSCGSSSISPHPSICPRLFFGTEATPQWGALIVSVCMCVYGILKWRLSLLHANREAPAVIDLQLSGSILKWRQHWMPYALVLCTHSIQKWMQFHRKCHSYKFIGHVLRHHSSGLHTRSFNDFYRGKEQ